MRRLMTIWRKKDANTPGEVKRALPRGLSWRKEDLKRAVKGGVAVGALSFVMAIWYNADAVIDHGYRFSAAQGLSLDELHITGRNFTSHDQIKTAIGASYGDPLLSLSLTDIKSQLEQLGWVKEAQVSRLYPNALSISINERRPLALLQTKSGHRLIDETGHMIFGAKASAFSHLPVVSGTGAAQSAKTIIESLRTEPELFADVWAIHRVSDRRWDVHLRTGLEVRLPEKNASLAWSKLAILDRNTKIMKRDLATIDLRVSGQLIVEPNLPLSKKGRKT